MPIIPPRDLPAAATVLANEAIPTDNGTSVRKATPTQIVNAGRPWATVQQAEAGTRADLAMSPLTTAAAVRAVVENEVGGTTEPLVVLFIGQSNMRGNNTSLGGDMDVPNATFVWNNFIPPTPGVTPTAGTAFVPFALGQYPADQQVSGQFVTTMPHMIMRELSRRTKRPIYSVTIACGGQGIEAFLRPATRTAEGWPLRSGDIDLTGQMYPQLANALAAVPGSPTFFDAVFMHQGEKNMNLGDATTVYRAKVAALMTDLVAQGVANNARTQFVAGIIAQANARSVDHQAAFTNNLPAVIVGLKVFDSRGLVAEDGLHFNGSGVTVMGTRAVDAYEAPADFSLTAFGTFTPVFADADTGGNVAGGTFAGVWRREGRTVNVHITGTAITTGGMTGGANLRIRGLPFAAADYSTGAVNLGLTTFTGAPTATVEPGQTWARIIVSSASSALVVLPVSALQTGAASIRFSLTYTTNS